MSESAYNPGSMISAAMPSTGITARENMLFQEYLANTAYQREMADAKAAGLNPWLMNISGASTPSGAQDSGEVLAALQGISNSNHSGSSSKTENLPIADVLIAAGMKKGQAEAIGRLAEKYDLSNGTVLSILSDLGHAAYEAGSSAKSNIFGSGYSGRGGNIDSGSSYRNDNFFKNAWYRIVNHLKTYVVR